MTARRLVCLLLLVPALFASVGCRSWCERHYCPQQCQPVGYAPAPYVPAPVAAPVSVGRPVCTCTCTPQ